jgi:hypothetical protein
MGRPDNGVGLVDLLRPEYDGLPKNLSPGHSGRIQNTSPGMYRAKALDPTAKTELYASDRWCQALAMTTDDWSRSPTALVARKSHYFNTTLIAAAMSAGNPGSTTAAAILASAADPAWL